jgi:hypothetical protein
MDALILRDEGLMDFWIAGLLVLNSRESTGGRF